MFRRHFGVLGRGAGCLSLKMFKAQNCSSESVGYEVHKLENWSSVPHAN